MNDLIETYKAGIELAEKGERLRISQIILTKLEEILENTKNEPLESFHGQYFKGKADALSELYNDIRERR